jgi:hypothetical protein
MTLSIMAYSITVLSKTTLRKLGFSIMKLGLTLKEHNSQHKDIHHNGTNAGYPLC